MVYNKINSLDASDFAKQNGYDTETNYHFVKKSIVINKAGCKSSQYRLNVSTIQ